MSDGQKVIKYLAIAFAIFLSVNIIGGIIKVSIIALGAFGVIDYIDDTKEVYEGKVISYSENYENIKKLKVECDISKLIIKNGEEFKVDAGNVTDKFVSKITGNTLTIKDNKSVSIFKNNDISSEITIYVPENFKFENVEIETGAGEVNISNLSTKNLKLELGAGNVTINNIKVEKDTEIDGGVGKVEIKEAQFTNLDLDVGVGNFEMSAKLEGNNKIDSGIGKLFLNLIGSKDEYRILTSTGIGKFTIDGKQVQDGNNYGNGDSYIKITSGIGETQITYSK
ncbi:MAG: DUF4097 family beta strand repeat protein [Clostridia bacterium]|nr:DUF4097 family beta strand repeat protein [Clostridia bacterium]